ncbi:MAG: hypothetical protein ACP6KW_10630 [Candidatus Thorarchaeota archaeon]
MAIQPRIAPLPSNAPPFAYEFCRRMRARKDVRKKPSVRQTQSIPQLLSARYFRKGELTLEDFLEAAVFTTYPPDQTVAREIAEDILLGRTVTRRETQGSQDGQASAVRVKSDALTSIMDQIRREQELRNVIQKDRVEAGYEYLKALRNRDDRTLYDAVRDYLADGDVVLRGISNDDEIREVANKELEDRYGGLTSQDIRNSRVFQSLDDLCQSPHAAERLAAKSLRGDDDVIDEFEDLARRDPATAARALNLMEELGTLNSETQAQMDHVLQENLHDLSEAADYARHLERIPDNLDELIRDAPQRYRLDDAAALGKKIEEHAGRPITEDLLRQYDEQYYQIPLGHVDLRQLAEVPSSGRSWKSLVDKETRRMLEDAETRSSPSDFLKSRLGESAALENRLNRHASRTKWAEMQQALADGAVEHAATKTHLRETVKTCSRFGHLPSEKVVRETGKRLGMTESEILEVLNPSFEVIKKLIKQGLQDFERLHNLLSSANLSRSQLRQLADLAAQRENQSALGAIAHVDFGAAAGLRRSQTYGYGGKVRRQMDATDNKRVDMTIGGLLGGPATNVIKIWFGYRDELPPELKERLRDIAKRLLIDLGMRFARATMGSSMLGGLQESSTVRPFRIGDDIDLINLEETIDSLLVQGRTSFSILEESDFLVTETYMGHRAFYWALDKSGSMNAPEKLGMLAISVMAGLYGVQKDDFGVVLFDHETHIVKEIAHRNVSVEKVASDLLDARAGGGTGGADSIRLALRNFEDTKAKEKVFIFSTDMYLSDQAECERLAERMKPLDIRMIILVPKNSYDRQAAEKLTEKSHGVILDIESIEELPAKLLKLTNY